jgi:hypothetical protein
MVIHPDTHFWPPMVLAEFIFDESALGDQAPPATEDEAAIVLLSPDVLHVLPLENPWKIYGHQMSQWKKPWKHTKLFEIFPNLFASSTSASAFRQGYKNSCVNS